MAIELGTVAPIGFDDFPPKQWLACFRRMGCTVVQVYRNRDAKVSVAGMQDIIAECEMPCDSLHGVFGEEFDPSAPLEPARTSAVDTFKAEGELAAELGGDLVVVHCSSVRPDGIDAEERLRRIAQLKKSVAELGRFGQGIGVRYAFENLPGYHAIGHDVAELAAILDELGAPNTGMCFDTGHANMVGDPAAAMARAGRQIIYLHFSDNSGRADEHEMPTYGTLDTDAIAGKLREIGYGGTMLLEVFHPLARLEWLIDDGCAERLGHILALANGRDE